MASITSHLRRVTNHNLNTIRSSPLSELSGSLGDLGTLLPLLLALTLQGSISFSSTLVFSGLANILTGLYYGIPLPVQPMKAIASIAISSSFSRAETASAGLFVASCVLLFSLTGLLTWFTRVVPVPVIRGIQVGAGLSLINSAGTSLLRPLHWLSPPLDNHFLTVLALIFLLLSTLRPRIPSALLLTTLGIILALISLHLNRSTTPSTPWLWHPHTLLPSPDAFRRGALLAGLPQLPLTTLNSLLAVSSLAASLSPPLPSAPSPTSLGYSVALISLIAPWFGAMPVCHGSGGLAAQYRFGARSGASVIVLGAVKLLLGLFVGDRVVPVLERFPRGLLGVMVLAAGVELAKVGRELGDQTGLWEESVEEDGRVERKVGEAEMERRWTVVLVTVAGCLAFKNDAVGFAVGMVWYWGLEGERRWRSGGRDERRPLLGVGSS
ncbi:putative molybdate transporter of MFS superfamily [Elsinoe australis]|uniref:Putative molybdate transporter of MFS superfamily n=1 Tax=Elsinoe australis TaxID=40998 RepID=A0A4U7AU68_9PEZI|nr:putative molybdate transporter of MFS superfamily [Elsinoe australis]